MIIHNMPRGSGKTTMMIEWLMEDNQRIMLVASKDIKTILGRAHPAVKEQICTPLEYSQRYFGTNREVGIDEVPLILQRTFGNVTKITLSADEEY